MSSSPDHVVVSQNEAENRFECIVEGQLCVADYQIHEGEMIMTHTLVPPELRGRGIAEQLVRTALNHAQAKGLRVRPVCSYVDIFIQRHAEYQPLVS